MGASSELGTAVAATASAGSGAVVPVLPFIALAAPAGLAVPSFFRSLSDPPPALPPPSPMGIQPALGPKIMFLVSHSSSSPSTLYSTLSPNSVDDFTTCLTKEVGARYVAGMRLV